jgi:hypothetical protein
MLRVGSRAQVMHGNAKMTGGGLKKKDLKYNKQGKIVSKKMSHLAKKQKRLQKAGYITTKGKFGAIRSMKGGSNKQVYITISNFKMKYRKPYINDWVRYDGDNQIKILLNYSDTSDTFAIKKDKERTEYTGKISFDTITRGKRHTKNKRLNIEIEVLEGNNLAKKKRYELSLQDSIINYSEKVDSEISGSETVDLKIDYYKLLVKLNLLNKSDYLKLGINNISNNELRQQILEIRENLKYSIFFNQAGPPIDTKYKQQRHTGIIKELNKNLIFTYESTISPNNFTSYIDLSGNTNNTLYVLYFCPGNPLYEVSIKNLINIFSKHISDRPKKKYNIKYRYYVRGIFDLCKSSNKEQNNTEQNNTEQIPKRMKEIFYSFVNKIEKGQIYFNPMDTYRSHCSSFVADVLICAFCAYKIIDPTFVISQYLPISESASCPPYKLYELLKKNKNNHWKEYIFNY